LRKSAGNCIALPEVHMCAQAYLWFRVDIVAAGENIRLPKITIGES